uniref:SUN domain-containing protein n=1 Tax=Mola mola TaxID=94237 RepID=A0A3Q4B442_MOLML
MTNSHEFVVSQEAAVDDLARLIHLERSVAALWEQVEAGGQRAEQRHREVLGLYADLQQQSGGHEASLSLQLEFLRTRLDEERMQSEQVRPGTHQDLDRGANCSVSCQISEQVSAQVREELQTLVYGNRLRVRGGASAHAASPQESLLQWLSRHYVSGPDLQASLASLELGLLQNISWQFKQRHSEDTAWKAAVTLKDVHVIVEDALRLFSQDKTGLADYALESGGGSILSTRCSETYETKAALLSLFGVPLWFFSQSPRAVIQPDVHLGNCWAFKGSKGFLVIRLSMRILPTAFSLEHIPKALAPSGTLRSAPRDFSVYGLDDERQERGELLGSYTYDQDGEAVQTFAIAEDCDQTFQIIEVQVLSNWGHLEYTCLYRFRVHGTPVKEGGP